MGLGARRGTAQPRIDDMEVSRAIRKSISRMLVGVLLFAQLAVASYACPSLRGMDSVTMSMSSSVVAPMMSLAAVEAPPAVQSTGMPPGCDQIDSDAANLCAEHCRQGQQSADTAAAPAVSPGIPTFLYSIPIEPQHVRGSGRSFPAPDASVDAAPEPPHAILHCVFRI